MSGSNNRHDTLVSIASRFGDPEEDDDGTLDADAEALLERIVIDDTQDDDRELIRAEYQRVLSTIKQQRIIKINLRIAGDTAQYQQAEGAERLFAKAAIAMQRTYPWLQAPA